MTVELWDIPSNDPSMEEQNQLKRKRDMRKCHIKIGTNKKTGRPLYISSFNDSDKLSVSAVPYAFSIRATNKIISDIEKGESLPKSFYGSFPVQAEMIIIGKEDG